jgi:hypothetical protein
MYRLMPFTRRALQAASALALLSAPALSAQTACVAGETTLHTGDPRLAALTPLSADTVDLVFEREGVSRPMGSYTQTAQAARVGSTRAWLFVQTSTTPGGVMLDSVWVDARSWAPLRHVAATPQHRFDVAYREGRVRGSISFGADSTRERDVPLPAGMFDYSVGAELLALGGLCPGTVLRIPGYDPTQGPREMVMRVVSAETVVIGGAPREVWNVESGTDGRIVRMQVDRATGRQLAWSVAGPGGATMRGTSRIPPR